MAGRSVAEQRQAQAHYAIEERQSLGLALAEGKWRDYFDPSEGLDIQDPWLKATVGLLLENTEKAIRSNADEFRVLGRNGYMEDVKIANVGTFDKYVFPMIRTLIPQLAATDLVSVQP